jgi:hypothetical protein
MSGPAAGMAKAPQAAAAARKSPAQVAAGKKFAAAGRAAQARRRAAYKKAGKKPPVSKAQHQAGLKWAAAGRAAQKAKKTGKKAPVAKKAPAAISPLVTGPCGPWALGGNDCWPSCAAAALANHLLAMTGVAASEEEILALHRAAGGGDEHAPLLGDLLETAAGTGLAGIALEDSWLLEGDQHVPGAIAVVTIPAQHAVLLAPDGMMITWGHLRPRQGQITQAWALAWAAG